MNYCPYCFNNSVDMSLTSDNDLSFLSVGNCSTPHSMYIRSGAKLPTALIVSQWDEQKQRNIDVGIYKLKFCPECGRKLDKNIKG